MDGRIAALGAAWLLLLAVLVWLGLGYRRLTRRRRRAQASWARIDAALRRRHELVPALVETVGAYAGPQRGEVDAVVAAYDRALAVARAGPAARAGAEQQLSLSLDRLFALADAYADLRGNGSFATLQAQLTARDDQVAYGRQFYNTAVQAYASATESLPTRVVARLAGFTPPEFFDTTDTPGPASLRR